MMLSDIILILDKNSCELFETDKGMPLVVDNGEGNSNLTTQSSIFNLILKTRVIGPLLLNYYDSI